MSEKLTPSKFSAVKEVSGTKDGRPYSFKSVGFLTKEHGDTRWFNITFKEENPLKEGTTYELDVTERPYTGKDGQPKVAYNAKFPTKESEMSKAILRHEAEIGKLWSAIKELQAPKKKVEQEPFSPPQQDDFGNHDPIDDPELPF